MKLGKHVSIAGGIDKAIKRAQKIGCNCLQIFSKNPRSWQGKKISNTEADLIKKKLQEEKMNPLVVHNTYLINPASPRQHIWEKSYRGLKEEYKNAGRIGAHYYVVHPGNHTGSGKTKGIKKTGETLNKLLTEIKNDTLVLIENLAGSGTAIGSKFFELYDIIKFVEEKSRIGICLDTCHCFAAGYDISNKKGIEKVLTRFDKELGLELLKVIHINDSRYSYGSKKDEHAHIGQGEIGTGAFYNIINNEHLKNLPFILETPQFEDSELDEDVELLFSLREEG